VKDTFSYSICDCIVSRVNFVFRAIDASTNFANENDENQ